MPLGLRPGLSFGIADGRAIFLNAHADLYFCLPAAANDQFLTLLSTQVEPDDLQRSVQCLLTGDAPSLPVPAMIVAAQGHLLPDRGVGSPFGLGAQMFLAQAISRFSQKASLHKRFTAIKRRQRQVRQQTDDRHGSERLVRILTAFDKTRLLFDAQDRCLEQSVALSHILASKGFRTSLVIGVRPRPFSAHCWLQWGSLVLNDELEAVQAYVPVLVVQ